jgi:putative membrane protein
MFGSRADLVVDLTLVTNVLAPVVALASFRFVRRRRHDVHRRVQLALLAVCVLAVVALEVRIRLAGGSGVFLGQSPAGWAKAGRALLGAHISAAVLTYIAWGWLAVTSSRRYEATLPGGFSRRHRRTGWLIFAGLCFNAVSATGMYVLAFVA